MLASHCPKFTADGLPEYEILTLCEVCPGNSGLTLRQTLCHNKCMAMISIGLRSTITVWQQVLGGTPY